MAAAKGDMVSAVCHLTEAMAVDPRLDTLYSNRAFAYASLGRCALLMSHAKPLLMLANQEDGQATDILAGTRIRSRMRSYV